MSDVVWILAGLFVVAIVGLILLGRHAEKRDGVDPSDGKIERRLFPDRDALNHGVRVMIVKGYDVADRGDDFAVIVKRPVFNVTLAVLLAFTGVGLIIYLLAYGFERAEYYDFRVGELPSEI